jgi:hypothetical protein
VDILKAICFVLTAVSMFFLVTQAHGAEWVSIGGDTQGTKWFYDRKTLKILPNNIIKVWYKEVYSDEGRKMIIQRRVERGLEVKAYQSLRYTLNLLQINCITRERRLMATSDYPTKGVALQSYAYEYQPSEGWNSMSPDSIGNTLYKAVCPPQEKK